MLSPGFSVTNAGTAAVNGHYRVLYSPPAGRSNWGTTAFQRDGDGGDERMLAFRDR